jgi:hypothetical protein
VCKCDYDEFFAPSAQSKCGEIVAIRISLEIKEQVLIKFVGQI